MLLIVVIIAMRHNYVIIFQILVREYNISACSYKLHFNLSKNFTELIVVIL